MKRNIITFFALVAGVLLLSASLSAHHGTSAYDEEHPVTMTGTLMQLWWANPHVLIMYDVTDAHGNVAHWSVETHDPRAVTRNNNWHKDMLKPGDSITITVYPSKSHQPAGRLVKLVLNGPDGRVLLDETRQPGRAPVAP
jgi:hypothetical protein